MITTITTFVLWLVMIQYARLISTYKCCVSQDNLCFVCEDIELDDVAISVSIDNFRVCV